MLIIALFMLSVTSGSADRASAAAPSPAGRQQPAISAAHTGIRIQIFLSFTRRAISPTASPARTAAGSTEISANRRLDRISTTPSASQRRSIPASVSTAIRSSRLFSGSGASFFRRDKKTARGIQAAASRQQISPPIAPVPFRISALKKDKIPCPAGSRGSGCISPVY